MSADEPTESEFEIISILLRFGGTIAYEKFKLKCKGKHVDADKFIDDFQSFVSIKNNGRENVVVVKDANSAFNILRSNDKSLWHHGQRSRRHR